MLLDLSDHLLDTKVIAPKIFYKEELASTNEKALNLNPELRQRYDSDQNVT